MKVQTLSIRAVKRLIESDPTSLKNDSFYLQVLAVKEFDTNANSSDSKKTVKLRCQLSDGESSVVAMMNKSVYDKMEDKIENHQVLQVFTFMKQTVKERVILVMTKPPKLIYPCKVKIGEPKDYNDNLKNKVFANECSSDQIKIPRDLCEIPEDHADKMTQDPQDTVNTSSTSLKQAIVQPPQNSQIQKKQELPDPTNELYTPIKALSTFNYDWRLKARLVKVYPKRFYKSNKGCLLNVELMDMYGTQIQATFFNDACEKFETILKQGCIFLMSNGTVKIANQKFQRVKNDFCLIFDKNAEIVEVPDDTSINVVAYNFVQLSTMVGLPGNSYVDFIGVVMHIGPKSTIQVRSGEQKQKRVISLADDSNLSIDCCVWQWHSDLFENREAGTLVVCKGARLVDFQNQKQMTLTEFSQLIMDPKDIEKCQQLTDWWKTANQSQIKSLNFGVEAKEPVQKLDTIRLICEMNEQFSADQQAIQQLQASGGGFFHVSAYVSFIKNDDRVYYLACPEENCRRKVIENDGMHDQHGKYRCEHCQKSFNTCVPTYMLLAKIADLSDQVFVNFYRGQAETIMGGKTAEQILKWREDGENSAIQDTLVEAQFRQYQFTVKVSARVFQEEVRLNFACIKATPLASYEKENRQLLRRLELYQNIPDLQSLTN